MKSTFGLCAAFTLLCAAAVSIAGADVSKQEIKKEKMKYELEPLEYSYNALEPYIDAETVKIHHDKHQAAYVAKLNAALESDPSFKDGGDLEALLSNLTNVPEKIRTAVRNNGGGVWNHTFYWRGLSPEKSEPSNELMDAIVESFGSFEEFKKQLNDACAGQFGSGWGWLGVNGMGKLKICTTANQDSPIMGSAICPCGIIPILTIDVWEHAYYLKYQNRRPEYLEKIWNIVNWKRVNERFENAVKNRRVTM